MLTEYNKKHSTEGRKAIFIKNVSELLNGICYEKSRITYDKHSDNFTMFIYFGNRNTLCLDAIFTGQSNYFFGSMTKKEIKEFMSEQREVLRHECELLSKCMIADLKSIYGDNYSKKIKLKTFYN